MRSFDNREDTHVSDEPFYAHYLAETGREHPGHREIIRHHDADWRSVAASLTGPIPLNKPVWYQKHMAHHMLESMSRDWMHEESFRHVFLLREPRRMLVSLCKVLPSVTLEQTGLPQQLSIFRELIQRQGESPCVINARDILSNPESALRTLCDACQIEFSERMLSWPPGTRTTDGIWAKHWYASVEKSTGFQPIKESAEPVEDRYQELLNRCNEIYDQLIEYQLDIP